MASDCQLSGKSYQGDSMPVFRGTHGLWKNYPYLRRQLVGFDEFITEDFFKDNPRMFWYVWGDVFNRHRLAKPHVGYQKLSEIIDLSGKLDKYFIYHSGTDKFYKRSGYFDNNRYVQAKGSIVDFQCKNCDKLNRDVDKIVPEMKIDLIKGEAEKLPVCQNCKGTVRPNINFRSDLGWLESDI